MSRYPKFVCSCYSLSSCPLGKKILDYVISRADPDHVFIVAVQVDFIQQDANLQTRDRSIGFLSADFCREHLFFLSASSLLFLKLMSRRGAWEEMRISRTGFPSGILDVIFPEDLHLANLPLFEKLQAFG